MQSFLRPGRGRAYTGEYTALSPDFENLDKRVAVQDCGVEGAAEACDGGDDAEREEEVV